MINLESILKSIEKLPTLPQVAIKALKKLDNPEISVNDVVSIIQYDQAITANVLKIANSAYYGKSRKVRSLSEALVLLGNKQLKEIILTSSVINIFQNENKGYQKAKGELWKHAASCAIISKLISKHMGKPELPSLFTAALIHDIGKLALDSYVERYQEQIIALVIEKQYCFTDAEKEMIGMNHAEVGAKIAEMWHFPEEIVTAIRLHHSPEMASDNDEITPIVHLANIITTLLGIGAGVDTFANKGKSEILKKCGLNGNDVQKIMVAFYEIYYNIQDLLTGNLKDDEQY